MFAKQQEQKELFKHQMLAAAEERFKMQFTTAIKMNLKQCHRLVAWRAHRWSIFPAERECVDARLMPLVFCALKSSRRCVLFQLVGLTTRVCMHKHMCACVCVYQIKRERRVRENNCVFQVEGQLLSLLLSIQQPSSLWRGLREALFRCCRGVAVGWLDASFQNQFLSKAQHMDDKLFYTLTTKVVKRKITKTLCYL